MPKLIKTRLLNCFYLALLNTLLFFGLPAQAQLFGPEHALSRGKINQTKEIFTIDINMDSLIDVLAVESGKIVWYENLGYGDFSFQEILIDTIMIGNACIADFDGDNDPDLAYVSAFMDTTFGWSENDGEGSFSIHHHYSYDTLYPRSIYAADLDMDDQPDLIVDYEYYDHKNVWFKNDSGDFILKGTLTNPDPIMHRTICFHDMDEDGDPDMIMKYDTAVSWLENDGNGIFQNDHIITDEEVDFLGLSDMDGDLDDDFLFFLGDNYTFGWKENLGAGSFGESVIIEDSINVGRLFIQCDDFDNDYDMDIVSSTIGDFNLQIHENLGNGIFKESVDLYYAPTYLIRSADFDEDGLTDLTHLLSNPLAQKIVWSNNLGNLAFSAPENITSKTPGPKKIFAEDMDGDNDPDITVSIRGESKIVQFENTAIHEFNGPETVIDSIAIWFDGALEAGDLDGDLDNDIYLASWRAYTFENLGNSSFGPEILLDPYSVEYFDGQIVDFTGDAVVDIIGSNWYGIDGFVNDGSGGFTMYRIYDGEGYGKYLHLNDIDGDEDMDMVFTTYDPDYIRCFENTGQGSFQYKWEKWGQGSYGDLMIIDLDGDNDNDLYANMGQKIAWYENDGMGYFGEMIILNDFGLSYCNSIYAGDLDNDEDNDIIYAVQSKVCWRENDGYSNFGPEEVISNNSGGVKDICLKDIDDDGDKDILYTSASDNKVAWHENLLITTFTSENPVSETISVSPNPFTTSTTFEYTLDKPQNVQFTVYNVQGQIVYRMQERQEKGKQQVQWSAEGLPAGIYYFRIQAGDKVGGGKMVKISDS